MSIFCFSEKTKSILESDFGVNNFFEPYFYSFFVKKRNRQNTEQNGMGEKFSYTKKTFLHPETSKKVNAQKWCQKPSNSII